MKDIPSINTGAKPLYYAPGAHEAYACPEGIEAYDVVLDKAEPLIRTVLDGNYLEHNTCREIGGIVGKAFSDGLKLKEQAMNFYLR